MPNLFFGLLPALGPLTMLAQIALCVHVVRTGRPYWWIWLLLFLPFFGVLVYLVAEVLPDVTRPMGSAQRAGAPFWLPRSELVRRARVRLEDSETVEHRLELAHALQQAGQRDEAADVAAEAAVGVHGEDPVTTADVAGYLIEAGRNGEANALLERASAPDDAVTRARVALLKARVLLGTKRFPEAKAALEELNRTRRGEEPRYWLAVCELEMGERAAATQLLKDLTQSYRKGSRLWRQAEREWYRRANRLITEMRAGR